MLKEISSCDAKIKLPEILRRVEAGEAFTITNRGKPIADLVPNRIASRQKTDVAINNILKAKKHRISDTLFAEIKENRRK